MEIKEKEEIAKRIKPISKNDVLDDFNKLQNVDLNKVKPHSRVGNKVVDYFTFQERLNTKGRRNISYFELVTNIDDYKDRGSYKRIFSFMNENKRYKNINEYTRIYNLFRLYFGSINIFKPLRAMEIYNKYKPESVLDFTMGWGGRLVGACALNISHYIGIDLNRNLQKPYDDMVTTLQPLTTTNIKLIFDDCLLVDYSKLDYDMVFTSPPYYNIELYSGTNKISKQEWDDNFYSPIFKLTYKHLKVGGYFILNVSHEIYKRVCIKVLGEADEVISFSLQQRPNGYGEFIYVWKKSLLGKN
jgi:hypothetical protein